MRAGMRGLTGMVVVAATLLAAVAGGLGGDVRRGVVRGPGAGGVNRRVAPEAGAFDHRAQPDGDPTSSTELTRAPRSCSSHAAPLGPAHDAFLATRPTGSSTPPPGTAHHRARDLALRGQIAHGPTIRTSDDVAGRSGRDRTTAIIRLRKAAPGAGASGASSARRARRLALERVARRLCDQHERISTGASPATRRRSARARPRGSPTAIRSPSMVIFGTRVTVTDTSAPTPQGRRPAPRGRLAAAERRRSTYDASDNDRHPQRAGSRSAGARRVPRGRATTGVPLRARTSPAAG